MKGECVCVKRFFGPVYVLVDLSYISQQRRAAGRHGPCRVRQNLAY